MHQQADTQENASGRLIQLAEQGKIPDFLVRRGIRRLLRTRLKNEDCGNPTENIDRTYQLQKQFTSGPIAIMTDAANEQHYEVPSAFFDLALGKHKKYSSCFYPTESTTLDQAEAASLQATCQRAELADEMDILELGCGWGSLTLWMAEHFPNASITAVSNSSSQREYILEQAKQRGIDGGLNVITCDINELTLDASSFDRCVSVEMFEHMRNYQELMKRISNWLRSDGKLFVHIFCHRELTYEFADQSASDWMSRYFFTGGIMPGDSFLLRFSEHLGIQHQWRWSGLHYHRTSEDWLKNMDQRRDQIMPIMVQTYGQKEAKVWFNRWRMFFLACSELFRMDDGNQWWVSHYLFNNRK